MHNREMEFTLNLIFFFGGSKITHNLPVCFKLRSKPQNQRHANRIAVHYQKLVSFCLKMGK